MHRILARLLTGHCQLRKQLKKLVLKVTVTCRFWEEKEIIKHTGEVTQAKPIHILIFLTETGLDRRQGFFILYDLELGN